MTNEKHSFAIYFESLNIVDSNQLLNITDNSFIHRITTVLRKRVGDTLTLFNKNFNIVVKIVSINKNIVSLELLKINKNIENTPHITMLISVLKKEAFHEAIYYSTEIGANAIQPIITQKVQNRKFDSKEHQKLEKTIIAAAEQSKNFNFPVLKNPITLQELLKLLEREDNNIKIYFDPAGIYLVTVLKDISNQQLFKKIYLMIGPEGDLTIEEKQLLKQERFIFCCLTSTVLRAQTAVSISLGIFRSLLKK